MDYLDLLDLLNTEEFKQQEYEYHYNTEFEKLPDYGVIDLYDDLKKEFGRIPSQTEYIESGLIIAEDFFTKKRYSKTFEWDESLIKSVKNRLARTYNSYLIESQVELYLKEKTDIRLAFNKMLDKKFGADICILKDDRIYYLHIAKDSKYSRSMLSDKGTRKPFILYNNTKYWWKRNWGKAHHKLLFNFTDDNMMIEINGNYLFNDNYLKKYFEELFESNDYDEHSNDSEIAQFYRFLRTNKIDMESAV